MRIFACILVAAFLTAAPALAGSDGHHRHHQVCFSDGAEMEMDGDVLVVSHDGRRGDDVVRITGDGELTVNGERIKTDRSDRKLLARFYDEATDLSERAEAIAADAEDIATASTAFAAHKIARVLKSLGGNDDEDADDLEVDFEQQIDRIEKIGDDIGKRADRLQDTADELREQIPALTELEWFLDD